MAPALERCFFDFFKAHKLNIIQHSKIRGPPLGVCSVKICCTAVLLCCCTADILYSVRSPAALRLRSGGPVVARAGPRDKVPHHDVVPAVRTSRAALVDARNVAPAHGANVVLLPSEPHHLREARCWWALRPRARRLGSRGHRTRRPLRADQPRRATARAPGGRGPTGRRWGRWSSACGSGFASSACGGAAD